MTHHAYTSTKALSKVPQSQQIPQPQTDKDAGAPCGLAAWSINGESGSPLKHAICSVRRDDSRRWKTASPESRARPSPMRSRIPGAA